MGTYEKSGLGKFDDLSSGYEKSATKYRLTTWISLKKFSLCEMLSGALNTAFSTKLEPVKGIEITGKDVTH